MKQQGAHQQEGLSLLACEEREVQADPRTDEEHEKDRSPEIVEHPEDHGPPK